MLETVETSLHIKNHREAEVLKSILLEYPWLGKTEILEVGQLGWLIKLLDVPRHVDETLVSLDFDDFLVDSLAAKAKLVTQLTTYLSDQYQQAISPAIYRQPTIPLDIQHRFQPIAQTLAQLSDAFARWNDGTNTIPTYHSEGQAAALAWGMQQLVQGFRNRENPQSIVNTISVTLSQIRPGLSAPDKHLSLDWFFMGDKLVTPTYPETHLRASHQLISETLLKPNHQPGVIAGVTQLLDAFHLTPLILTSGSPSFQLMKLGEFFKTQPHLRPALIALAKNDKGSFLLEAESDVTHPSTPRQPLKMIHFDDLPEAAESLAKVSQQLKFLDLVVARFKFQTGKAADIQWQPEHPLAKQFDLSHFPMNDAGFAGHFVAEVTHWQPNIFHPKHHEN